MITGFDWDRCNHEGIGLPGCETCDPIDQHRNIRLKYELSKALADLEREQQRVEEYIREVERRDEMLAASSPQEIASQVEHHVKTRHGHLLADLERVTKERDAAREMRSREAHFAAGDIKELKAKLAAAQVDLERAKNEAAHGEWESIVGGYADALDEAGLEADDVPCPDSDTSHNWGLRIGRSTAVAVLEAKAAKEKLAAAQVEVVELRRVLGACAAGPFPVLTDFRIALDMPTVAQPLLELLSMAEETVRNSGAADLADKLLAYTGGKKCRE